MALPIRKKSLLIGINYTGSQNELHGCQQDVNDIAEFLYYRGYPSDPASQAILRDDRRGWFYPNRRNILAAMDWLVSEPNTRCFLHYSGHGAQVPDDSRKNGIDDTIVPVDFERNGMIDSESLHRHLVTHLAPGSTLFVIFDCCHSGSAMELPYVYRTDAEGRLARMQDGKKILTEGADLLEGGFDIQNIDEARDLFSTAQSFLHNYKHRNDPDQQQGLQQDNYTDDWGHEQKWVTMFSGCRDDQTSADASINGSSQGAMSWAFLEVMKRDPNPTYMGTLQHTRQVLDNSNYSQVPQLSVGLQFDMNAPLLI